jgi:hypothetical protein
MSFSEIIVIIVGLALFETISSIDNAVVNAEVLSTLSPRWRRWFLFYGIIFAVFVVRGLMPLLIVYFSTPGLSLWEAFIATFSSNAGVKEIIERQAPILLAGGGVFLIFLFFNWLFLETKQYAFFIERHIHRHYYFWFYAFVSALLLFVVGTTMKINPLISIGAVAGSTAFFIVSGFRRNVEEKEKGLVETPHPDEERPAPQKHLSRKRFSRWFVGLVFLVAAAVIWLASQSGSSFALGLTIGIVVFAAVSWFRRGARKKRRALSSRSAGDLSKVLYLELIDATFSIDGVLGAFAFTISVPLILIGNGIGAILVRYLTVHGVETVKKYAYLKNGAMYSIGFLGVIMILESLGRHVAAWVPPLVTFLVVGLFFYLSKRELEIRRVV